MKLLKSPFPVMLLAFSIQRVLKVHLGTQMLLEGHSKGILSIWRALEGHLNTWDNRVLEWHLGTQALEGHFDTKALIHLGTHTSRHVIYQAPSKMANNPNFLLGYVTEMTNERLE